jgi:hypothetical protein
MVRCSYISWKTTLTYPKWWGRTAETRYQWDLARHGEARVAPTAELPVDVVRSSRMAYLKALSWQCPLAPHHFLDGIREWFPRKASRQALQQHQQHHLPAKSYRVSDQTFLLSGKEVRRPLPFAREGSMQEKPLPLGGGRRSVWEKAPPLAGRKAWTRRLRISPKSQGRWACGRKNPLGDPLSPPTNVHGGCTAVTHSRGKAKGIITTPRVVM